MLAKPKKKSRFGSCGKKHIPSFYYSLLLSYLYLPFRNPNNCEKLYILILAPQCMEANFSVWDASVAKYHQYSIKYPMYQKTGKFLVKKAKIKKGMMVLDLACGTGITTKEILKSIGREGEIIALDSSEKMINICKSGIKATNVHFIRGSAEKLNKLVHRKIDVVICNAAFWQLVGNTEVLKGISSVLKLEGILVFNIPLQYYKSSKSNRVILSVFKTISEVAKKYGYCLKKKRSKKLIFNYDKVKSLLVKNKFKILSVTIFKIKRTPEDLFEFFKISIMNPLPYVPQKDRVKILNKALMKVKNKFKMMPTYWIVFIAKKYTN